MLDQNGMSAPEVTEFPGATQAHRYGETLFYSSLGLPILFAPSDQELCRRISRRMGTVSERVPYADTEVYARLAKVVRDWADDAGAVRIVVYTPPTTVLLRGGQCVVYADVCGMTATGEIVYPPKPSGMAPQAHPRG